MPSLQGDLLVSRYNSDGFVFPIEVMSAEDAVSFRRRLESTEARYGRIDLEIKSYLVLVLADQLVHHPAILDAVELIIGPDILVWDADFIIKEAHDPHFVSWHQDLTYWGLEPDDEVTAWVALSPSTVENGCVRFLPGTHAGEIVPHIDTFAQDNMLTRGQSVHLEADESDAVDVVLEPGQISLHNGKLIHGSRPNRSDDRRIGFAIRYVPTHVRQVVGARDSAMLVRGVDAYRHFESEPRPSADFEPGQLALRGSSPWPPAVPASESRKGWRQSCVRLSGADRSGAAPRHGEGGGTWRMDNSASIALQSMPTNVAAASGPDSLVAS